MGWKQGRVSLQKGATTPSFCFPAVCFQLCFCLRALLLLLLLLLIHPHMSNMCL